MFQKTPQRPTADDADASDPGSLAPGPVDRRCSLFLSPQWVGGVQASTLHTSVMGSATSYTAPATTGESTLYSTPDAVGRHRPLGRVVNHSRSMGKFCRGPGLCLSRSRRDTASPLRVRIRPSREVSGSKTGIRRRRIGPFLEGPSVRHGRPPFGRQIEGGVESPAAARFISSCSPSVHLFLSASPAGSIWQATPSGTSRVLARAPPPPPLPPAVTPILLTAGHIATATTAAP